ncbi:MAG: aspartate aminotransferase family protein [Nitrososphaerota archaeon]
MVQLNVEQELEQLSFSEAPRIAVKPPGPRSRALLQVQERLETRSLIYPKLFPFAIDAARGATLRDVDGNYYIDWAAGIAVLNAGHNNPYVAKAVREQLERYWHWLSEVPSEVRIEFLRKVNSILPAGLRDRAKFMTCITGADACEAAVALARWAKRRPVILAFEGAYHGVHQGIVVATAKRELQRLAGVPLVNVVRLPYPYPYRCPFGGGSGEECGARILSYVEHLLSDPYTGIGEPAAVIVEPIQGEGGYIIPPRDFLRGLRELCDRHGLLLIADEVQSGVGRTGRWWAVEHFGVVPDIICISKAIGGGIPLALVAYREELDEGLEEMFHLGTYRANPLAMAAGRAVVEYIEGRDLLRRTWELGEYLKGRLAELAKSYPLIGDVRGLGFMVGIELVKPGTKEPWPEAAARLRREMLERGLLMHTCGHYANVLRFMAPLVLSRRHLEAGLGILEQALRALS